MFTDRFFNLATQRKDDGGDGSPSTHPAIAKPILRSLCNRVCSLTNSKHPACIRHKKSLRRPSTVGGAVLSERFSNGPSTQTMSIYSRSDSIVALPTSPMSWFSNVRASGSACSGVRNICCPCAQAYRRNQPAERTCRMHLTDFGAKRPVTRW